MLALSANVVPEASVTLPVPVVILPLSASEVVLEIFMLPPVSLTPPEVMVSAPVFSTSKSPDVLLPDKLLTAVVIGLLPLMEPTPVAAVRLNVEAVTSVVA